MTQFKKLNRNQYNHVLPSLTQAWVKFSDKNVEEATQAIFKSSELRGNVEVGTSIYSICHLIKNKPPRTTITTSTIINRDFYRRL